MDYDKEMALHKIRDEVERKHLAGMRDDGSYIGLNLRGNEICLDGCFSVDDLRRMVDAMEELQKEAKSLDGR